MQAGIGLPSYIRGTDGETLMRWAEAADQGPFSSLSVVDKTAFASYDPLIALAGAAAVTKRVNLITTVLLAATWEPVRLAKQAASLDVLSGGRFILGVSSGGAHEDYVVTGYPRNRRGRRLDAALELLHRTWRGESLAPDDAPEPVPVGPAPFTPGGPKLLIGAVADVAIQRVGRYADGFIATGMAPQLDMAEAFAEKVRASWSEAGRSGAPMLKKAMYFALGPDAAERGLVFMHDYYDPSIRHAGMPEAAIQRFVTTPEGIREVLHVFEAAGFDEICFWPTFADRDQMERLADIVG